MTYTIRIKDLQVQTLIGVYEWERTALRPLLLQVELQVATPNAAATEAMQDAVDYAQIESCIVEHAAGGTYQLLESFVTNLCQLVLALDSRILHVKVEADKPGALQHARSVSVAAEARRA
ncbi:MAG: dihydroneopterin aldolase [Alphaproteobacteria bacterium]|nr:dihydroneopterin aldolase [Alphaproteobacteria bacterium]